MALLCTLIMCSDNLKEQTMESEVLLLPAAADDSSSVRRLSLGETQSLEELGPIIINADGTTRRISNWDSLSKDEQESSWRVIRARNNKRLTKLKKKLTKLSE